MVAARHLETGIPDSGGGRNCAENSVYLRISLRQRWVAEVEHSERMPKLGRARRRKEVDGVGRRVVSLELLQGSPSHSATAVAASAWVSGSHLPKFPVLGALGESDRDRGSSRGELQSPKGRAEVNSMHRISSLLPRGRSSSPSTSWTSILHSNCFGKEYCSFSWCFQRHQFCISVHSSPNSFSPIQIKPFSSSFIRPLDPP